MRETGFSALSGNFHAQLFFHGYFLWCLIIQFYENVCHFFTFLENFTNKKLVLTYWKSCFLRKGTGFSRWKKNDREPVVSLIVFSAFPFFCKSCLSLVIVRALTTNEFELCRLFTSVNGRSNNLWVLLFAFRSAYCSRS